MDIGDVFGKWTIIGGRVWLKKHSRYLCRCSCGCEKLVRKNDLLNGNSRRCQQCKIDIAREKGREEKESNKESRIKYNREYQRRYRKEHNARTNLAVHKYRTTKREQYLETERRHGAKRRATITGKLNNRICADIHRSIKANKAGRRWESLVGYTVHDLKSHIGKQFKSGMSWELFMAGQIHIDHKIPKSAFYYETVEDIDFRRCWDLSNLQPMWATDNIRKSNKVNKPFQPSLAMAI